MSQTWISTTVLQCSVYYRYFGQRSMKVAMNYHLVARTHSCRGDFRAALQSEKEAYAIYKQTVSQSKFSSISSLQLYGKYHVLSVFLWYSIFHFLVSQKINKQKMIWLVIVCYINLLKLQKKITPSSQKMFIRYFSTNDVHLVTKGFFIFEM